MSNDGLPLFDAAESKARRDAGIESVTRKRWIDNAISMTNDLRGKVPEPFAVEDLRKALTEAGLEDPHHVNAWGAFGMSLSRRKMIARTGEWRHAKSKTSHARFTLLYRWL